MHQHDRPQEKALRRLAVPNLAPAPGLPLIRSTPSLGRRQTWLKGRSTVPAEMTDGQRKTAVFEDAQKFIKWMEDEEHAHYRGQIRVDGPHPHFDPHGNDVQVGDRGGMRELARNIQVDTSDAEYVDYNIYALFDVPEAVNEIPTDLAVDILKKDRADLRPLRPNQFKEALKYYGRN